MQGKSLIPYHYFRRVVVFFILLLDVFSVFGQDSTRRTLPKDTVFPRIDSLKAAIVTTVIRPRLKGDTTEYNTVSIRLRPNANVQELLGRLPGLQIGADGTITYNGEKIQHLLVDGEDIFGSDPTMVTSNFDASKIARVQILDRKSDKAIFTGIDDGTRTKTLNLVIKESAKDGYFGKVEAGGNTDGYYSADGALAAFRKKEQFTTVGVAANTGVLGFSSNVGGSSSSVGFGGSISDALGASAGMGIPEFAGTAIHYANSWNGPQDHASGNYQYSHFLTYPLTTTQTLQAEPGYTYAQDLQSASTNQQDRHWAYGTYDWVPGKVGTFRFDFRGSSAAAQNQFSSGGSTWINDTLVNSSQLTIRDRVIRQDIRGDASWRTTIRKSDRVVSITFGMNKIDNSTNGYLYSLDKFPQLNENIQSQDTVDQRKQIANHPESIGGSLNYTEPLWAGSVLAISSAVTVVTDHPQQTTYTRGDGKYQEIVDSLSSYFQTQTINQRGILNLQGRTGYLSYTIGSDWIAFNYRQKDLLADSALHQHYVNWTPRFSLNYTRNPSTNLRFIYASSTQQPAITQLQPVKNNNDPIHITLGNPDLRPAFTQNFYLDFSRLQAWNLFLRLDLNLINNDISTKTITDSLGRQISQPVNVDGDRSGGVYFNVSRKAFGFDASFHSEGRYSRTANYVNANISMNTTYTGGGGLSLNKSVPDKCLLQLNTTFTYFDQSSSINTTSPVRYWSQNHSAVLTIFFLQHYEFNNNAVYIWQQKTSSFAANTSVLLWNCYISRNFLQDKLVLRAQWNNIFNQHAGITRSNVNNINTQTSTNILGRYWMLSAIYHFDRKFKQK